MSFVSHVIQNHPIFFFAINFNTLWKAALILSLIDVTFQLCKSEEEFRKFLIVKIL